MEQVNECLIYYGLEVSEKKSNGVCIHYEVVRRRWMMGDFYTGEVEAYRYFKITVKGGNNGGFNSMGDIMKEADGLIRMERSGSI